MGRVDFATARITLHPLLLQVERRSTLTHELVHLDRGPLPARSTHRDHVREEAAVDEVASRLLVHVDELVDAVAWTDDLHELADELWVDLRMLLARLERLAPHERVLLERVVSARDGEQVDHAQLGEVYP